VSFLYRLTVLYEKGIWIRISFKLARVRRSNSSAGHANVNGRGNCQYQNLSPQAFRFNLGEQLSKLLIGVNETPNGCQRKV